MIVSPRPLQVAMFPAEVGKMAVDKVLVTGASGFVGSAVARADRGWLSCPRLTAETQQPGESPRP
jgi:hypothetical protein